MGRVDVDIGLFVNSRFIEEECIASLWYVERGWHIGAQTFPNNCEGGF